MKGDNTSCSRSYVNMELRGVSVVRAHRYTHRAGRCAERKIAYKHEILEPPFYNTIVKTHATQISIEEYQSTRRIFSHRLSSAQDFAD